MPDQNLLILIVAALALVALVGGVTVARVITARRRRELERRTAPPQIPADAGEPDTVAPPTPQPEVAPPVAEPAERAEPEVTAEPIEPKGTRLQRLRRRLAGSNNILSRGLLALISSEKLDEQTWEDFEDALLTADLGVGPTTELVTKLRQELRVSGERDPSAARALLRQELITLVDATPDRSLNIAPGERDGTRTPAVVLVVGVNGTGKTTTVGKLGRLLVSDDHDVIFGAADTFRAAAVDQLQTWGERVGVPTVRGAEGGDPSSVAFDAIAAGIEHEVDVVLIDTAGRLHTKVGLMDELGKVKRVIEKQAPISEVLLVLDATTGQNGLIQARLFAEAVQITGVVLTKLDGSAKGGIVVQVQRELGVPVKFVGLGEGADDLAPFQAETFVDALLEDANGSV